MSKEYGNYDSRDVESINTSSATMTRPNDTTAYAAGDVIGTSPATVGEFTNVGVAGSKVIINQVEMRIDVNQLPTSGAMAGFRLHLYSSAPTAIADNAVFNLPSADRAKYLGYISISNPIDIGDTLISQELYVGKEVDLVTTSLYWHLETLGAFTPTASCIKTITLR